MCGDESINPQMGASLPFLKAEVQSAITKGYRIVSGLNGNVPKGAELLSAINVPDINYAVETLTIKDLETACSTAAGSNPSYADMLGKIIAVVWDPEGIKDRPFWTLPALDFARNFAEKIPARAGDVATVLKNAAESAKGIGENYATDSFNRVAQELEALHQRYLESLKPGADVSAPVQEPITL